MERDTFGMLGLHQLASKYGDGLKSEFLSGFEELALQWNHPGATALNPSTKSAGPVHQYTSDETLDQLGIKRIGCEIARRLDKDGTDG